MDITNIDIHFLWLEISNYIKEPYQLFKKLQWEST